MNFTKINGLVTFAIGFLINVWARFQPMLLWLSTLLLVLVSVLVLFLLPTRRTKLISRNKNLIALHQTQPWKILLYQ
jgi:cytochrome c-type biogenesis protein CcmH/NrfF